MRCLLRIRLGMVVLLLVPGLGLSVSNVHAAIVSTFDVDSEGWTKAPGSDPASTIQWVSTGGNPGGYLRYNEAAQGGEDFIAAPAKFLGNKASYYGGTLSFDIRTNLLSSPLTRNNHVMLIGGGYMLRFELPLPSPVDQWHSRSMDLIETSGWVNNATGQAPTQNEMLAVLGDLTSLRIRADYRNGPETPSFDNIQLIPEPATVALLALGGLALVRRRR